MELESSVIISTKPKKMGIKLSTYDPNLNIVNNETSDSFIVEFNNVIEFKLELPCILTENTDFILKVGYCDSNMNIMTSYDIISGRTNHNNIIDSHTTRQMRNNGDISGIYTVTLTDNFIVKHDGEVILNLCVNDSNVYLMLIIENIRIKFENNMDSCNDSIVNDNTEKINPYMPNDGIPNASPEFFNMIYGNSNNSDTPRPSNTNGDSAFSKVKRSQPHPYDTIWTSYGYTNQLMMDYSNQFDQSGASPHTTF